MKCCLRKEAGLHGNESPVPAFNDSTTLEVKCALNGTWSRIKSAHVAGTVLRITILL
jgi:hypothetical protein